MRQTTDNFAGPSNLFVTAAIAAAAAAGATTAVVLAALVVKKSTKDNNNNFWESEVPGENDPLDEKCHAFKNALAELSVSQEFDRMVHGKAYNPEDPGLVKLRQRSRELIHEFNNCGNSRLLSKAERDRILATLMNVPTVSCHIEPPFHVDYGCNIRVGSNFYANFHLCCLDCAQITIGDNVFCGPGVHLYTATHPLDFRKRRETEYALPIDIGDDVWIGGNSVILPGVCIGNRVVVAAGSVVTKTNDTNGIDDVVLAGIPAKIVKKLTSKEDTNLWFVR